MSKTTADKMLRRIRAKGRGSVFTPKDFLDIGSRDNVDKTLSRLADKGLIRRLDRGLFDLPKVHPILGVLSPTIDKLAQAVASKTGNKAFPSGAAAANILGLTTQVPARPVFLTNGTSAIKNVAGRTLTFQHARIPLIDSISLRANYTLQALHYLGRKEVDSQVLGQCLKHLDDRDIKGLTLAAPKLPAWMVDVVSRMKKDKHGEVQHAGH